MLIKNKTSVYDFNFHLVFVTKYRKTIFQTDEQRNELKTILKSIAKEKDIQIQKLEVMPEHVSMLITFKPKYAPANIVKAFKGVSARMWFKSHPETKQQLYKGHLWSPSYFMSTIGNVSEKIVMNYIEQQMAKSLRK